jgi:hypothetical protein
MRSMRGLLAACLVVSVTACTTTATITQRSGPPIEGSIRYGTTDYVVVEPRDGNPQKIPRSDIDDIDHPGNVHLLVGGIVLGYGTILIGSGLDDCQKDAENLASCTMLVIPAIVGAGLTAWGLATWSGSKSAASQRLSVHRRPPEIVPAPERSPNANAAPKPAPDEPPGPPAVLPPLPTPSPSDPALSPPPVDAPDAPAPPSAPEPPPDTPVW